MTRLKTLMARIRKDETGAPATEYSLLIAAIAIIAVVGMGVLGTGLNTMFNGMGSSLSSVNTTIPPGTTG